MIAVGGMGGSGTRVVAQILMEAGIYMGSDLNESLDNIWFTRLFKNTQWKSKSSPIQIQKRFSVFKKLIEGEKLSVSDISLYVQAGLNNNTFPMSSYQVYQFLKECMNHQSRPALCGWKEPNSQIYIDQIAKYWPGIKYVQVIRNGIEMAYSTNTQQLHNWGQMFGIQPESGTIEYQQLEFWIRSNEWVFSQASRLENNHFHVIHYDNLMNNPRKEIERLLTFLNLSVSHNDLNKLAYIPSKSSRSYIHYDTSPFSEKQIAKVAEINSYSP